MRGFKIVQKIQMKHEFRDPMTLCTSLTLRGVGSSAAAFTLTGSMIILDTYLTYNVPQKCYLGLVQCTLLLLVKEFSMSL